MILTFIDLFQQDCYLSFDKNKDIVLELTYHLQLFTTKLILQSFGKFSSTIRHSQHTVAERKTLFETKRKAFRNFGKDLEIFEQNLNN